MAQWQCEVNGDKSEHMYWSDYTEPLNGTIEYAYNTGVPTVTYKWDPETMVSHVVTDGDELAPTDSLHTVSVQAFQQVNLHFLTRRRIRRVVVTASASTG